MFKYENKNKTAPEIIDQLTEKFFIQDSRISFTLTRNTSSD